MRLMDTASFPALERWSTASVRAGELLLTWQCERCLSSGGAAVIVGGLCGVRCTREGTDDARDGQLVYLMQVRIKSVT